jgi:hypothetical protein
MNFPFRVRLIDTRWQGVAYEIMVKDQRDWKNIKSLEETGSIKVQLIATRKRLLAE